MVLIMMTILSFPLHFQANENHVEEGEMQPPTRWRMLLAEALWEGFMCSLLKSLLLSEAGRGEASLSKEYFPHLAHRKLLHTESSPYLVCLAQSCLLWLSRQPHRLPPEHLQLKLPGIEPGTLCTLHMCSTTEL